MGPTFVSIHLLGSYHFSNVLSFNSNLEQHFFQRLNSNTHGEEWEKRKLKNNGNRKKKDSYNNTTQSYKT